MDKPEIAGYLRSVSKWALLVAGIAVFVFSLLSGADTFGGGLMGIVYNSPNAIPWAFLLVLVYLAWKNELWGGALIMMMGLFTIYAFGSYRSPLVFSVVTLPLLVFGGALVASWYLSKK